MKFLLFALLITAIPAAAQNKQPGYIIIRGSAIRHTDAEAIGAASLTVGRIVKKSLGLGLGAEYCRFNPGVPYIPLFMEASYLRDNKKIAPYLNMRVGFGIYSENVRLNGFKSSTSGGLYLSPGAGVYLPATRKIGAILAISYVYSGFRRELAGDKTSSSLQGGALSLGIKF